jgi:hypothetical protein
VSDGALLESWLAGWEVGIQRMPRPLAMYFAAAWLDEPARWSAFFRELLSQVSDPGSKARIVRVCTYYFWDADMVSYIRSVAPSLALSARDGSLVAAYLLENQADLWCGTCAAPLPTQPSAPELATNQAPLLLPEPWFDPGVFCVAKELAGSAEQQSQLLDWVCEVYRPKFHAELQEIARILKATNETTTAPPQCWKQCLFDRLAGESCDSWREYVEGANKKN